MALDNTPLITHLTALRDTLLRCVIATAVFFPVAFWISPYCIEQLIRWCCPPEIGTLNYFSPMEVLIAQLKLSLILSLAATFPYSMFQIWRFLLPALYTKERQAVKWWVTASSVLFLAGALFCLGVILPMMMTFSAGFSSDALKPMIGLAAFLDLAGWMMLAFGLMFQFPLAVLIAVRFGLVTPAQLRGQRPFIIIFILVLAALLTPPDIVSQLCLAFPTWLLFEIGLLLSARHAPPAPPPPPIQEDHSESFYQAESERSTHLE